VALNVFVPRFSKEKGVVHKKTENRNVFKFRVVDDGQKSALEIDYEGQIRGALVAAMNTK
jgi:hypothetical protein